MLQILAEQHDWVAINKPHGLLVHPSSIARDATEFAVQQVRDQIGQYVYPAHRLDRKTAGVLLFAKNKTANAELQGLFRERKVRKIYKAIVRGFLEGSDDIDYALTNEGKTQAAQTHYRAIQQFEIPLKTSQFPTSRYTLVELTPHTGRFHQLRKHLAHIFHPIIGDRPHGCNKQNRFWKSHFQMTTMLLHAEQLAFEWDGKPVHITAEYSTEFQRVLQILGKYSMSEL